MLVCSTETLFSKLMLVMRDSEQRQRTQSCKSAEPAANAFHSVDPLTAFERDEQRVALRVPSRVLNGFPAGGNAKKTCKSGDSSARKWCSKS
jgi:hypothetical protein